MSKVVVLDPGHGGSDPGAVSTDLREKDLTLKIAKRVRDTLVNNYNVTVKMTRSTDEGLTLRERTNYANRLKADYFCSIHINAGGGTGYEDYIYNKLSDSSSTAKKRDAVHNEVKKVLSKYGITNRGKKKANYHVLRESNMSAMLSENLFIDTAKDQKLLKNNNFLNDIADAHAHGIAVALGLKKGSSSSSSSSSKSSKSSSSSLLKQGSRGKEVKDLQQTLKKRGYYVGNVDGIFGPKTFRAVCEFQRDAGIKSDGIVGPQTRKALEDMLKYPGYLIKLTKPYMSGRSVKAVQRKVGVIVDGLYGPKTEKAVKNYQAKHGLQVDGIVGPKTWGHMF